ncbi:MAG: hypothetical protein ONB30_01510 [candidate division KSB1 bacterium]|nr:hypothetical protein [candidate division KSB1 bacterium]
MRSVLSLVLTLAVLAHTDEAASPPSAGQNAEWPVLVATSGSPLATAYNNGRRMVRDSRDHRYIAYQDLRGNEPIVCLVRSADGRSWSSPDTIAEGRFPSLAIDREDRLFLVWQSPDSAEILLAFSTDYGESWQVLPGTLNPIPFSGVWRACFPVVEAGLRSVHVAWQQQVPDPTGMRQCIFFASLSPDSLGAAPPGWIVISLPGEHACFPSLAYNLAFEPGCVHVAWADSAESKGRSIAYRRVDEATYEWIPPLHEPPLDITAGICPSTAHHPAVSVGAGEVVHVVWNHDCGGFHSLLFFDLANPGARFDKDVSASPDPMVCVDDVYWKYSALVWVKDDEVYYMQTRDAVPISSDPIAVSDLDGVPSRYPSLCYKHFRADSLDVVWTDGSQPPYRILYRRMEKIYRGSRVGEEATFGVPSPLALQPGHPNPTNACTAIDFVLPAPALVRLEIYNVLGQKVRTLVDELRPAGRHQVRWNGLDDSGRPLPGGLYLCRLRTPHGLRVQKLTLLW